MSNEENMSVEETQKELAQPTESISHNDVSQETQEAESRQRNDAEYNWAEMRRQIREKDQQIDDLKNQFYQMTRRSTQVEEEDELANLAKDDIITVEQAEKLAERRARKIAEEVFKQREAETVEERVQLKYSDYADVVSKENIELLKRTEPELAQSLYHMPDPYSQAVAAYKLLKKISVKTESPSLEKKKAMENSQKPLSVNAVTQQSAIGNVHIFENGLTREMKSQLWKEMKAAMKAG